MHDCEVLLVDLELAGELVDEVLGAEHFVGVLLAEVGGSHAKGIQFRFRLSDDKLWDEDLQRT